MAQSDFLNEHLTKFEAWRVKYKRKKRKEGDREREEKRKQVKQVKQEPPKMTKSEGALFVEEEQLSLCLISSLELTTV